jgi:hypothetical protein
MKGAPDPESSSASMIVLNTLLSALPLSSVSPSLSSYKDRSVPKIVKKIGM